MDSFDDHSEDKLISWLEGGEDVLHRKTIRQLKRIRREMWHYLMVHHEMSDSVSYGTYQSASNKSFWRKILNLFKSDF